jgi:hypothetical protein
MEYLCHKWPRICSACRKHCPVLSSFVTRLTWRVPLVEQKLITLPEHLNSPPVFCGVRITRSLVLYVWFVDRCLFFCNYYFGHCVVCSCSIYDFWLPLWYLRTLLPCYDTQTLRAIAFMDIKMSLVNYYFFFYFYI